MSDSDNLVDNLTDLTKNLENDIQMQKIKKEVIKKFDEYRNTMAYMAADAPISILCLSPAIENALSAQGLLRVYDLFNCDFVKIKGLGRVRIGELTACLDKFLSML